MKLSTTPDSGKKVKSQSFKKISMRLPLGNEDLENNENKNNEEENISKSHSKEIPQRIIL